MITYTFSDALELLKGGKCLTRKDWNSNNQWIALQKPDENSFMTRPYIFVNTKLGNKIPWVASQADLLTNDWIIFNEEE